MALLSEAVAELEREVEAARSRDLEYDAMKRVCDNLPSPYGLRHAADILDARGEARMAGYLRQAASLLTTWSERSVARTATPKPAVTRCDWCDNAGRVVAVGGDSDPVLCFNCEPKYRHAETLRQTIHPDMCVRHVAGWNAMVVRDGDYLHHDAKGRWDVCLSDGKAKSWYPLYLVKCILEEPKP